VTFDASASHQEALASRNTAAMASPITPPGADSPGAGDWIGVGYA